MSRRAAVLLVLIVPASLAAQTPGTVELRLGLHAASQRDPVAAVEHLARATGLLDAQREKGALVQAYLQLGLAYLAGLDRADRALPAFIKSGELGSKEGWLWAAMVAEKLGGAEEAAHFRALALPQPADEAAVAHQHAAPAAPAPGAFEHFFGEEKEKPTAAPTPTAPPSEETKPAADAFQYFFGKKKPAPKPEDKVETPPPPPPPGY